MTRKVLMMLAVLAAFSCTKHPRAHEEDVTLGLTLEFPKAPAVRADVGYLPAGRTENEVHELMLWVFESESHNPVVSKSFGQDELPSDGLARRYALPVGSSFASRRPDVDVFVLANGSSIGSTLSIASDWNEVNSAVFGGAEYFSPQSPVTSVDGEKGLPMSGVGKGMKVGGSEPSLSLQTISVGRAVSKLRYIFSQMKTVGEEEDMEKLSVDSIVLAGGQIPLEEYVFSESGSAVVHSAAGSDYVSLPMKTIGPGENIASSETPEKYSWVNQDPAAYEALLADVMGKEITDGGTFYLRESDLALSGTVYYSVTKGGESSQRSKTFSMDSPGDFARNHTWTLYGYFLSNRSLQLAIGALPWDKNNYTVDFSNQSVTVTSKLIVEPTSAEVEGSNVYLVTGKPAKCHLYITTPKGGKLYIRPQGDTWAFNVSPEIAEINPSVKSGRIDISISQNSEATGDVQGKYITLSFTVEYGGREIQADSEVIDSDRNYRFIL